MPTDFSATTTLGQAPFTIHFISTTTDTIELYEWDFGDGFTSELESPSHEYNCSGVYDVILVVTKNDGTQDTVSKEEYIQITQKDPKIPEEMCCFGPYTVECIGCSSGEDNLFYDSSKTFKSCRNVECYESCLNKYGLNFNIDEDYVDDCPECRECYIEHKTQLGRYYSLTITNCNVLITDYYPENECGSCIERSESHCFAINTCESGIDMSNPPCKSIFDFDDKIFVVVGSIGDCIVGSDCEDCWEISNNDMNTPFSFLPEEIDECNNLTSLPDEVQQSQTQSQEKIEIVWHNEPGDSSLGTNCFEPILIPESAIDSGNDSSYRKPDISTIPSGHSVIAYEEMDENGINKISLSFQHTSVKQKITHWRSLGKGTLLNSSLSNDTVKFLVYDDVYYKSGSKIGFKNGPLEGKLYSINSVTKYPKISLIPNYQSYNSSLLSSIIINSNTKKIYAIESSLNRRLFEIEYDGSLWDNLLSAQSTYVHNFFIDFTNNYLYVLRRTNNDYTIERTTPYTGGGVWSEVLTFTTGSNSVALNIDVDSGKAYYTIGGEIRSVDVVGGGDALIITTTETLIPSLKVYENKIYWTEYNDGNLKNAKLDGSNIETIVDQFSIHPWGLDISEGYVYWTEYKDKYIRRCDLDGSVCKTLLTTVGAPRNLAVDTTSQKIFWVEGTESGSSIPFDLTSKILNESQIVSRPYYEIEVSLV